jgi:peroxiredoxin
MNGVTMRLKIGEVSPEFELPDVNLKMRKLSEFKGNNLVLAFFPGAFTSVCTKELCTIRDSMSNFNRLNAKVLGISVDSPFSLAAFRKQNNITFDLLSDHAREVSRRYGIIHENFANIPSLTVSKRSIFIVDKTGVLKYIWISDNPAIEPNYSEVESELSRLEQSM